MWLPPLLFQRRPLADAEAVLFVRDDQAQAAEGHVILYQGVSPDEDVDAPLGQFFQELLPFLSRRPARQQDDADVQALKEAAEFFIVLGCQDARRRHEGPLIAVLYDLGQGQGGDDGLAGADIALDQALHGHFALHIGLDIEEGLGLAFRQGEGQVVIEGLEQMAVRAAFDALALAFMAPAQEQAELHVEELFKG